MKVELPEPAISASQLIKNATGVLGNLFTQSQLRAAMVAAFNEGIEEAAKECEGMKVRAVRSNYEDAYRHAASAIRKMKETP